MRVFFHLSWTWASHYMQFHIMGFLCVPVYLVSLGFSSSKMTFIYKAYIQILVFFAVTSSASVQSLPAHVVKMVLKALKLNSEEARLKFPRLLQLVELYSAETLDLMVKEVELWIKFRTQSPGGKKMAYSVGLLFSVDLSLSFTMQDLTVAMFCLDRL